VSLDDETEIVRVLVAVSFELDEAEGADVLAEAERVAQLIDGKLAQQDAKCAIWMAQMERAQPEPLREALGILRACVDPSRGQAQRAAVLREIKRRRDAGEPLEHRSSSHAAFG
jgi:hypothetical protein